jgi:hypothetical protein
VVLTIILTICVPGLRASAETTEISTDNFTANVGITEVPDITITGITELTEALNNLTEELDDSSNTTGAMIAILLNFGIAVFLMVIAVWRKNWYYYVIAGFVWLIIGFQYITVNWVLSVALVLAGIGCFVGAKFDK